MLRCRAARPEKGRSAGGGGGGGSETFFSDNFFFLLLRHLHYGVGVPSDCQTRGEKPQNKRPPQKGGPRPIRPPSLDSPTDKHECKVNARFQRLMRI